MGPPPHLSDPMGAEFANRMAVVMPSYSILVATAFGAQSYGGAVMVAYRCKIEIPRSTKSTPAVYWTIMVVNLSNPSNTVGVIITTEWADANKKQFR